MNKIFKTSTAMLFATFGSISTVYAADGPPYKAECAEAEAMAHAEAQGRTWVGHDGVTATVGPVTGDTGNFATVGEDAGEIEVDVKVSNRYVYSVGGLEYSEELGAPRCTYGSNVSVSVKESASAIFQTGNPEDRHGGYQQVTDLVRDGHYGVWFPPGTKVKSVAIPITDNERPQRGRDRDILTATVHALGALWNRRAPDRVHGGGHSH